MERATERLEFDALRSALARRTETPLGEAEARQLAPFETLDAAKGRVEAIRQCRGLLERGERLPLSGAQDVRAALELGEKGVMLDGPALRAVAHTMAAGSALRRYLLGAEEAAPILYGMGASLPDLSRDAAEIEVCFDSDGQLRDDASSDLGPLRHRVRSLRETIHERLSEILSAAEMQPVLQERYFTVRGDRYVLPIRASFKNEVKGIVHDASGSGQTVYIEPVELVDLGNRLKIAQSEQLEEEHRILSRLTHDVVRQAEGLRTAMTVLALCDLVCACARLSTDLGCAPIVPDGAPGFDLRGARHPLLLLQARQEGVVPNDVGLEPSQRILVITGPNTGGKTVAMKTVGLLALMIRHGLHLPCKAGSRIGWYGRIEVAIGDLQSIASNLSTFAAHVKTLVEILARADERTLVLIDEIAADTDPMQGQALAQAILERLADRGAQAIVTTHFEQLKAVPFVDRRFRNAGVGFDAERHVPTYRVTLDVPQSSSGFDIAINLGLGADIVDRARRLTGEGAVRLDTLFRELETRTDELARARLMADRARSEAEKQAGRLRERELDLEREIASVRRGAREGLLDEIEDARERVRRVIRELQAKDAPPSVAMRSAGQAREELARIEEASAARAEEEAIEPGRRLSRVEVGDWVHVARVGRDGEVASLEGRDATVVVGKIRVRVPRTSLLEPVGRRPRREAGVRVSLPAPEDPRSATVELDLRGLGIEESIDRLEAFLDYHYRTPTRRVRVVHGHGTGALRDAVREHLKRSGYVRLARPGESHEGGDGVTVVELS